MARGGIQYKNPIRFEVNLNLLILVLPILESLAPAHPYLAFRSADIPEQQGLPRCLPMNGALCRPNKCLPLLIREWPDSLLRLTWQDIITGHTIMGQLRAVVHIH